jgi:hypothetical protein
LLCVVCINYVTEIACSCEATTSYNSIVLYYYLHRDFFQCSLDHTELVGEGWHLLDGLKELRLRTTYHILLLFAGQVIWQSWIWMALYNSWGRFYCIVKFRQLILQVEIFFNALRL